MAETIKATIQLRRATEAKWTEIGASFIPKEGEPCLTLDGENAGKVKYGDGINTWSNLLYNNEKEIAILKNEIGDITKITNYGYGNNIVDIILSILKLEPSPEEIVVFSADFSGIHPSASQFYTWENRIYDGAIYDSLNNINCQDNIVDLQSKYDVDNSRWIKQMMTTAGLFETDNFICTFKAKFSEIEDNWNNVITYGTGTYWTDGMYSDGIKWPSGGEIDAFEQYSLGQIISVAHYGSGTNSGYPDTHLSVADKTTTFTPGEWHDFKFELENGNAKIWIDNELKSEMDLSSYSTSNNYLFNYHPFLKPQAFYIDGSCHSDANIENIYHFYVKDFKILQNQKVECSNLEIYPQMWNNDKELNLKFPVGAEIFFDKIFTPNNTSNKACVWEIDNPEIASVCQGYVKCKKEGQCTITARCGNAEAKYLLYIDNSSSNIPCVGMNIIEDNIKSMVGETYDLKEIIYIYPSYTTNILSFSSDSEFIELDDEGNINFIQEGNGEITVQCGELSKIISFEVKSSQSNLLQSLDIDLSAFKNTVYSGEPVNLIENQTYTFTCKVGELEGVSGDGSFKMRTSLGTSSTDNKAPQLLYGKDGVIEAFVGTTGNSSKFTFTVGQNIQIDDYISCVFTIENGYNGKIYLNGELIKGDCATSVAYYQGERYLSVKNERRVNGPKYNTKYCEIRMGDQHELFKKEGANIL